MRTVRDRRIIRKITRCFALLGDDGPVVSFEVVLAVDGLGLC